MDPGATDLQAFLAAVDLVGQVGDLDLVEVRADFSHTPILANTVHRLGSGPRALPW